VVYGRLGLEGRPAGDVRVLKYQAHCDLSTPIDAADETRAPDSASI
jgi:hypothetical protein